MSGKPKIRQRHAKHWTREEDALLRREWGELGGRELVARLHRSANAIVRRACNLGLPPSGAGRASVKALGRRLGCTAFAVDSFARECGMRLDALHPVSRLSRGSGRRGGDADQIEVLYALRVSRVVTLRAWDVSRGRSGGAASGLLRAAGLPGARGRRLLLRVPEALLDELAAGVVDGPWSALWRRVAALSERPCASWLLALAAWDLRAVADGRAPHDAAEWTDLWLPGAVRAAARSLAGVVMARPVRAGVLGKERAA